MEAALAAVALAVLFGMFGVLIFFLLRTTSEEEKPKRDDKPAKGGQRRRGALDRMQAGAAQAAATDGAEDDDEEGSGDDAGKEQRERKKEERRQQVQAARAAQHERDAAKTERSAKYSQKQSQKDTEREKKDEDERRAKEEKERKEKEEFDKWKEMFAVEAEGEDDGGGKEENAVENFIDYVKLRKVVNLEDLSGAFKMRTSAAIDRIRALEKLDRLSGIFDDRGKYIYIDAQEMSAVAAWLKKKGRINRVDLVAACNRLIRLNPTEEDQALLESEARSAAADLLGEANDAAAAAA